MLIARYSIRMHRISLSVIVLLPVADREDLYNGGCTEKGTKKRPVKGRFQYRIIQFSYFSRNSSCTSCRSRTGRDRCGRASCSAFGIGRTGPLLSAALVESCAVSTAGLGCSMAAPSGAALRCGLSRAWRWSCCGCVRSSRRTSHSLPACRK